MTAQNIIGLVPTLQATALVGENIHDLKKIAKGKGSLTKTAVKNIVGISLLRSTASLI